ncbi:hypothetical protein GIB67_014760 [Kingdonia uniflora]|uniref:Cell division control protein 24 OB domain-containing protein n=1 Tax=Kingdonia uniflora TaxID=39325 RepID=A0A7J7NV17_9MAGN|nr:hypothetical protein GIB67_014760 [Kingdonia uniflora]
MTHPIGGASSWGPCGVDVASSLTTEVCPVDIGDPLVPVVGVGVFPVPVDGVEASFSSSECDPVARGPPMSFVTDLRDKMTSISLYGIVVDIFRQKDILGTVFILKLEDTTGAIIAKLHFVKSWSLGRVSIGHTIFMSGLSCSMTSRNVLEVSWLEKDTGTSLVNLSCLPALLNSSCLHKLSYLSDLTGPTNITHVCSVRIDHIEHYHIESGFSHSLCGHFASERPDGIPECSFCNCTCVGEVIRTFQLKLTLADERTKILSWCTGQTAAELLQISPDDFYDLPEDEQAMYMYTIENERFMAAIVSSKRQENNVDVENMNGDSDVVTWEIVRALKCE